MAETLAILKDTPIPTLMILGGIALLVLSVVSSISDKVKVAPERQKWSWIAGLILVVIGVALFVIEPGESALAPTATPTRAAQATAPQATATQAAPSVTPTPTSTSEVTILCTVGPDYFAEHWLPRINQLGCPLASIAGSQKIARQNFEHGYMFGRSDTLTIYALLDNHTYQTYQDNWKRGMQEYSCPDISPAQTPPTPRNGFGLVWCQFESARQALGAAISDEQSLGVILQTFEHGLIFEAKKEIFLLVESSQAWEQLK